MDAGDEVYLRVKIYLVNEEQALITFISSSGQYSTRVPVSELRELPDGRR